LGLINHVYDPMTAFGHRLDRWLPKQNVTLTQKILQTELHPAHIVLTI